MEEKNIKIIKNTGLGHVMIDIETLGNESFSVITSIAALEFNLNTGEIGREFYKVIDIDSCLKGGLVVNGKTLYWWLKQNDFARNAFIDAEKVDLEDALNEFTKFIKSLGSKTKIWGNSPRFDLGILANGYTKIGKSIPWGYGNELDVRTIAYLDPSIKERVMVEFANEAHHPIIDCKKQIKYVIETHKRKIRNEVEIETEKIQFTLRFLEYLKNNPELVYNEDEIKKFIEFEKI